MSLLSFVGKAVVKRVALGAAVVAVVKIDEKNKENVDKHLNENPISEHLMIEKDVDLIGKDAYGVYDENKEVSIARKASSHYRNDDDGFVSSSFNENRTDVVGSAER